MKNRIELAEYFRDKGYKKGAEIGVCEGRYSKILLDTIPGLELIGVDPYEPYDNSTARRNPQNIEGKLEQARELLGGYPNYNLIIARSIEVAKLIPNHSLDFVFIDGLHDYDSVKADIEAWYPKVRYGGIVSGHDYYQGKSGKMGVMKAVDEFVEKHGLELQTTEWDEEAYRDDRQPDWFIEK